MQQGAKALCDSPQPPQHPDCAGAQTHGLGAVPVQLPIPHTNATNRR